MQNTIEIACPQEILLGLHLDAEQFADLVKEEAKIVDDILIKTYLVPYNLDKDF